MNFLPVFYGFFRVFCCAVNFSLEILLAEIIQNIIIENINQKFYYPK
ncbi:hypothetical protein BGP_0621 [Beggiatoa sp. PS]|nr:hypothetical protein BGP_0621 [Beggiatoa sp. PS]